MAITKVTTGTIADDSIQSLKNRNIIINGAMQVAQRATQVTGVTTDGYKTCDRWVLFINALATWTVDQSTDSPNGFSNSLKVTCTTADASPAARDYAFFSHRFEAQNLQHLAFGTADAKSMTLSFWVKSNKTGNASCGLLQLDNSNKTFSESYTINSADTWEYKTISIPADTAGLIDDGTGYGLQLEFWTNGGSDHSSGTLATTWSTFSQTNRNPSNLGVGGAVSDYFAITGVQLEVGDIATDFEHEDYGTTLAKCQRYFQLMSSIRTYYINDQGAWGEYFFSTPLRTYAPTIAAFNSDVTWDSKSWMIPGTILNVTFTHSINHFTEYGGSFIVSGTYSTNPDLNYPGEIGSSQVYADAEL